MFYVFNFLSLHPMQRTLHIPQVLLLDVPASYEHTTTMLGIINMLHVYV